MKLGEQIEKEPGVEQVIAWGNELRVCGSDANQLKAAISHYPNYDWQLVGTSLEEVFIHLVDERAVENE